MHTHDLASWLAGWDDSALTALLERRPDTVVGRPPADIRHLADRLSHPASIAAALRGMPAPAVQTLEALQALGERRTRDELIGLLAGGSGPEHEAAVDAVLAELTAAALVWPAGDRLSVPSGLAELFPSPLGLGPGARDVWSAQYADGIARALRAFGERPVGRKAEQLEALLARLADPEQVRRVVTSAPLHIADTLQRMAWSSTDEESEDYLVLRYDPEAYRQQREAERWAADHGLVPGNTWGPIGPIPAEVALALRGEQFRAPFTPRPPETVTKPVSPEAVDSAAAAAVTAFTAHALALLDRMARSPVPTLAGGGIGVRELGRLTKELGVDELETRLILELAAAGGLLLPSHDGVTVGARFAEWRAADPATQAAGLLAEWWDFPVVAGEGRDENGKALPVFRRREPCAGCQASRVVLVSVAAELPAGQAANRAALIATAGWTRPLVHVLPQDADEPLATVWREAELLGVLAAGTLSPLGAALLADDGTALDEHLRRLLPEPVDTAVFGSDLTALVAGTPSARITALLDSCADRESSGGAVTWRFSPSTVRRALDEGTAADVLREQLAAVSDRPLPQPLAYLIADVGRRHGRLRLLPAVAVIRSDDEALLAEVAADRRLVKLGLQPLAPTVLACAVPLEQALARLRQAGYFPVDDRPAQGSVQRAVPEPEAVARAPRGPRTPVPTARLPVAPDPEAVARALLEARESDRGPEPSEVADELVRCGPHLSPAEIDWITAAVEDGGRLRIEYVSASGATTRRVIEDPDLDGGMLYAWCQLRQDERVFAVSRILSVTPVN